MKYEHFSVQRYKKSLKVNGLNEALSRLRVNMKVSLYLVYPVCDHLVFYCLRV